MIPPSETCSHSLTLLPSNALPLPTLQHPPTSLPSLPPHTAHHTHSHTQAHCYDGRFGEAACGLPSCPAGTKPMLNARKGVDGVAPCCDTYACIDQRTGETAAAVPKDELDAVTQDAAVAAKKSADAGAQLGRAEDRARAAAKTKAAAGAAEAAAAENESSDAKAADAAASQEEMAAAAGVASAKKVVAITREADEAAKRKRDEACPRANCELTPAPIRCPVNSSFGQPAFKNVKSSSPNATCAGCTTCMDDNKDNVAVDVPVCFREAATCGRVPECLIGYRAKVVKARGAAGAEPCCDAYQCALDSVAQIVPAEGMCPQKQCGVLPHACPVFSSLSQPVVDVEGIMCPECLTCLDDNTKKPVTIPTCYKEKRVCGAFQCQSGETLVKGTKAGIEGEEPCCDEFSCVPTPEAKASGAKNTDARGGCAALRCAAAPHKCPWGSKIGVPASTDGGCPKCATCLDNESRPVPVPTCFKSLVACAPPACRAGTEHRVVKTPAGANGTAPCCTVFECAAGPPENADGAVEESAIATADGVLVTTALGTELRSNASLATANGNGGAAGNVTSATKTASAESTGDAEGGGSDGEYGDAEQVLDTIKAPKGAMGLGGGGKGGGMKAVPQRQLRPEVQVREGEGVAEARPQYTSVPVPLSYNETAPWTQGNGHWAFIHGSRGSVQGGATGGAAAGEAGGATGGATGGAGSEVESKERHCFKSCVGIEECDRCKALHVQGGAVTL